MGTSDNDSGLDQIWDDLNWAIGQLFFMGWEGTEVTPQIKSLIEDHHLGAILLTAKNLRTAQETANLVQELQTIAHKAGHPVPLLIGLDQENGGVNSLFDEDYICQFPSAMGIAATDSLDLAYEVAKATAQEISAVGVNLIMGPVLDVLSNARYQPLGVRAPGDDPQEVSQYCIASINAFKDVGIAPCGKHFPSYGNLDFLGSSLEMPIITDTIEQLSLGAFVPFRNAISNGLDAMMIGGCAMANNTMNVMHACLSDQVVRDLLRNDLGFTGVAISECLEMDALSHDIGVRSGTVMAVEAGCDLVLFCRSFAAQQEAISGLKLGIENGMISRERIMISVKRILHLKSKCTNWHRALNPPGVSLLSMLHPSHLELSMKAYDKSITVVRDRDHHLPLLDTLNSEDELLLLTPLVNPLPASTVTKSLLDTPSFLATEHSKQILRSSIMTGEGVFRELGRSLARQRNGKLLHTSYTANGVRPVHENLINRASAIIIVTADANRNLYQNGFTKHVATMCSLLTTGGRKKALIVVSVSSPYDFALDPSISTYVCTYDFTETAMRALVRALFGEFIPQGTLPGTLRKSRKISKSRQNWLVENWDPERDCTGLQALIKSIEKNSKKSNSRSTFSGITSKSFEMPIMAKFSKSVEASHYVVRNSSTKTLFGFCSTYFYSDSGLGVVSAIFTDPFKRNLSIGFSLHQRAISGLLNKPGIKLLQLGSSVPSFFPGIPMLDLTQGGRLKRWFVMNGWGKSTPRLLYVLKLPRLRLWNPPEDPIQSIQRVSFAFDITCDQDSYITVLEYVSQNAGPEIKLFYDLAKHDGNLIARAKSPIDGSLVGTMIITRTNSQLSDFVPAINSSSMGSGNSGQAGNSIGRIFMPIVTSSSQSSTIIHGLIELGIQQCKIQGHESCIVSQVQGEHRDVLIGMGFDVLNAFEELRCASDQMCLGGSQSIK